VRRSAEFRTGGGIVAAEPGSPRRARRDSTAACCRVVIAVLTAVSMLAYAVSDGDPAGASPRPPTESSGPTRIALDGSTPVLPRGAAPAPAGPGDPAQPLTVTLTLRRSDEPSFQRFLSAVQNPSSAFYHRFLTQDQLTATFGPSVASYDQVLSWVRSEDLTLVQGSANRLTLTVTGSRAQVEKAFGVTIADYRVGGRTVYSNTSAPALPANIAGEVQAVSGLSDVAEPAAPQTNLVDALNKLSPCLGSVLAIFLPNAETVGLTYGLLFVLLVFPELVALIFLLRGLLLGAQAATKIGNFVEYFNCLRNYANGIGGAGSGSSSGAGAAAGAKSARGLVAPPQPAPLAPVPAQKIGLLEFDTYHPSDVQDWVDLSKSNTAALATLTEVPVNGGVASPGSGESEVLLDINTVLDLANNTSPPQLVVYDAPPTTSFEQMFNAMLNDGDTVISNSWSECEDQVPKANAQSIDSVLAQAAASGVSVFNGSGDHGSSCLDGAANTVGVPTDSPNATSVGGTTPTFGPAMNLVSQRWWDGSSSTPPTGSGGYGVSKYFPRPAYQNGLTTSPFRSVPDLAVNADPTTGIQFCQADDGGCPDGHLNGGTSMTAPEMAILTAQLNQSVGHNVGNFNAAIYPVAATPGVFTTPADMGTDFSHVGLGAPNFNYLYLALTNQSVAAVSPSLSTLTDFPAPADGATHAPVRVQLLDGHGFPVRGKSVGVTVNSSTAVVSGSPALTDGQGVATFAVTDTVAEAPSVTAVDASDGVTLSTPATIAFFGPTATGASITASPPTVPNDGSSKATVTVYLENSLGRPASGKTVSLSPAGSNAVITPPSAQVVTANNGEATFTTTDTSSETVTFTAIDVTDGNLPVPGSAVVTFQPAGTALCTDTAPAPVAGYGVSTFASGFVTNPQPITTNVGGLTFTVPACTHVGTAFDSSGNAYVGDAISGEIFRLGTEGGPPGPANKLPATTLAPGLQLGGAVFARDGALYAGLMNTNGNFRQPQVVQLDPATGATVRVVASAANGLEPCPGFLAADPVGGDLFVDDFCSGATASGDILRISNPASATPTVSVYANVGEFPDQLVFSPNGTLYAAVSSYTCSTPSNIVAVGVPSTNTAPHPTSVAAIPGGAAEALALGATGSQGQALSFYTNSCDGYQKIDLSGPTPTITQIATGDQTNGILSVGTDGCLYASQNQQVYKITGPGLCGSVTTTPELALTGPGIATAPTGGPVTFTARLNNVPAPAGIAIEFVVSGSNDQVKVVHADASGTSVFTYAGVFPGTDTVTAFAVVNGKTVVSVASAFRWVAGRDTSFLSLNRSQGGGPIARPATLTANLADIAQTPPAPITDAGVTLTLGGQSCAATTDSSGNATCTLTPTGPPGLIPVTASYAGTASYTPASANDSFAVTPAAAGGQPPAITSPATATFTVGAAGAFTVVATGSPTPTLAESGTLPPGVTFNPATGVLAGTPAAGTVANYPVTFTATNGIAPDATQAFTLNVVRAKTSTTVTAAPPDPGFATPVTFSATVAATATNSLSPTGTVSFFVDGRATAAATAALVGGHASVTTSALGAGQHSVVATYNGDGNFAPSTSVTPVTETIGCATVIRGDHPGSVIVSSGIVCVVGAHVGGAVVVAKGASIDIEGSTISGAISAEGGAGTVRICGTTTSGSVTVQRLTGLVIVGDPGDAACQPNRIGGALVLQNNTGGVEAINNTVSRLVASNNSGPGPYPGDMTTITGNHS
jgi:Pro-kumamolisin, activation domain/Bacterial Ig-like domain (group 3)/Bacterial Ig-like domain (group 1)/Putative Ig domain